MLSLPLNTVTPALLSSATGGNGCAPGALVMIATPPSASFAGGAARDVERDLAERIGVAHRDVSLHAERARARDDLLDLEHAEHVRVVQVDVDVDAVPLRDAEHHVELRLDVAVDHRRVEPADQVAAVRDRGIEQLRGAGTGDHAVLRKRDELDVEDAAVFLAHRHDGLERRHADRRVDIDVAAHVRGAARDAQLDLRAGAVLHRRRRRHVLLLELDALAHVEAVGARTVRLPVVADEARVEMDVPLDETRNDQRARQVDFLRGGRRLGGIGLDGRDPPVRHRDGGERAIRQLRAFEQRIDLHQVQPVCFKPAGPAARCGRTSSHG